MRKRIKQAIDHPLISGSILIVAGSFFANVINFFFNLYMSRNLSPSDYGVLASLVALITLTGLAAQSIIPTVVNFAATYFAKKEFDVIRGLFFRTTLFLLLAGGLFFLTFLLFSQRIGDFLNIEDNFLVVLTGAIIFLSLIAVVNLAFLQAKLSFGFIAFLNFVSASLKLSFGVLLVLLGFSVKGAMWAYFSAFLIPYFLGFLPLRFLFKKKAKSIHISSRELFGYGIPAAMAMFSLTALISTDLLLVKHFFDANQAGLYAVLALAGKVIYFLTAPIGVVMFPLIVQKFAKRENYDNVFRLALLLVLLPAGTVSVFYSLFPVFSIKIFNQSSQISTVAPYLGIFSLFMTAYSLLSLITNFYLSIKKTNVYIPLTVAAFLQAVLIWFNHQTFLQVVSISLGITVLLLLLLLLYYFKLKSREKKLYGKYPINIDIQK